MANESVLLLNATYEPIGLISWKRAVTLVIIGKGELVEQHEDRVVRSAGGRSFPFPSVVRLVRYVRRARLDPARLAPNRRNLTARDRGLCQVKDCEAAGDTIDHLLPRSRGGVTSWENCVLMCNGHNTGKGNRTLTEAGFQLKRTPARPRRNETLAVALVRNEQWAQFAIG
ncbi:MAG: HNH endonuclease [Acidimicrobiia bacterium]|nr:HNH endonuclease [Acidimicrobiia bacterium]